MNDNGIACNVYNGHLPSDSRCDLVVICEDGNILIDASDAQVALTLSRASATALGNRLKQASYAEASNVLTLLGGG